MNAQVDVLANIEAAVKRTSPTTHFNERANLWATHGAVAELIEAAAEMNRLAKGPTGGVSQSDKRAIVARITAALAACAGESDPADHEPPPDDIGPYPYGWDNYRDSSCLVADLVGAEPTFRSENEDD